MSAFYILIVFASFFGFLLALYIRHKKSTGEEMICPIGSNCQNVIYSEYSKFLGIPVEMLGLFYYSLMALTYGILVGLPDLKVASSFILGVLTLSLIAFLFSLYLTFIQAFYLRAWCTWCLMSAGLCTLILFSALAGSDKSFVAILLENQNLIQILTVFIGAVGVGSATLATFLVFNFVKDLKISFSEAETIFLIDQISWLSLAGITVSSIANFWTNRLVSKETTMILPELYLLILLIASSAFLYLLVVPKMIKISLREPHEHRSGELKTLKNKVLSLGSITLVCWYALFLSLILP